MMPSCLRAGIGAPCVLQPRRVEALRSPHCVAVRSVIQVKGRQRGVVTTRVAEPDVHVPGASNLAFRFASQRLQSLLDAASWECDDEAIRHELSQYTAEMKLTLATNLGSLLALVAFLVSWLTGEDPLGGFGLSDGSLDAAAWGAAYALPLLACSAASRLPAVRSAFPVLEELQDATRDVVRPLVADLTLSQLLVLSCAAVVPSLLLLLPALHGCVVGLGHLLAADVLQPLGQGLGLTHTGAHLHLPYIVRREAAIILPAVTGAYAAAWVLSRQFDVKVPQVVAIREAWSSSDRYFLHAAAERMAEQPELLLALQQQQQQQQHAPSTSSPTPSSSSGSGGSALLGSSLASGAVMASSGAAAADPAAPPAPPASSASELAEEAAAGGVLRRLGAEMSDAFKTMSITWLLVRRRTARLAYVLTALNVAYLGVIWHDTRDLATPVTAALLLAMAELLLLQHCPNGLGAQAGGEGSSSSGGNGAE